MSNTPNTSMKGGVCNLNPTPPTFNPQVAPLPSIPIATDLRSAIAAANAMRQIILNLTNAIPSNGAGYGQNPNLFNTPGIGGGGGSYSPSNPPKNANFREITQDRVTKDLTVPIVDQTGANIGTASFKQITKLVFFDPKTKQTITYQQ